MDTRLQRFGGAAAVAQIGAIVVQALFFFVYLPNVGYSANDMSGSVQTQLRLLSAAREGFLISQLLILAFFTLLFVVVHALYVRLRHSAPALSPLAAAFGYASAGLLMLEQVRIVTIAKTFGVTFNADQMTYLSPTFDALRALLENGASLLAIPWLLLVSVAALRNRELTRPVAYLGIVVAASNLVGALGIVPIPAANPLQFIWLVCVGIVLVVRPIPRSVRATQAAAQPASA